MSFSKFFRFSMTQNLMWLFQSSVTFSRPCCANHPRGLGVNGLVQPNYKYRCNIDAFWLTRINHQSWQWYWRWYFFRSVGVKPITLLPSVYTAQSMQSMYSVHCSYPAATLHVHCTSVWVDAFWLTHINHQSWQWYWRWHFFRSVGAIVEKGTLCTQ